ncbi:MAG: DUF370 domain-containing protein [Clostridia bacterium]|nr:DUF370 domain-containing protein [Clostridia bacterium]
MILLDVGSGNFVNAERIIAVVSPDSLPVRRLVQDAKNAGRAIDVTTGKKTKSVIVTDSDHVICSALEASELNAKLNSND